MSSVPVDIATETADARPPFPSMAGRVIVQIIPELDAGGAERTVLEMTEAICAAGGTSLVVSTGGRLVSDLQALGGELIAMNARTKNPVKLRANAATLAQLIAARSVDLIHARSRAPAWSAYWAAQRTQTPFVTTYHGAYAARTRLKRAYNSVMARGDRVIANSQWTAQQISASYDIAPERLVTIPRGVDLMSFAPANVTPARIAAQRESWLNSPDDDRLVLLLPGRLTDWKGQKLALDALGALSPDERSTLLLVFLGDHQGRTKYVGELVDTIEARGLSENIKFSPHTRDMPAAYRAADIVLTPSTRPEAFGRTAAEASAMQRPVIAADHGGARETVIDGQTGVRFAPGDARALAAAIRTLVSIGKDARDAMGMAGRRYIVANFSKYGLQMATLGVYADLIKPTQLQETI